MVVTGESLWKGLDGLDSLENFRVIAIDDLVKRVVAIKCSGNQSPYVPVNRTA